MIYGSRNDMSAGRFAFFRWVGSKRRIAQRIANVIGDVRGIYYEPFCGAASVFFSVGPERAQLSDLNGELINCLTQTRDNAYQLADLANDLITMIHGPENYRAIRSIVGGSDLFRAARFLALQATSFQGLWRTNRSGVHNVPPRDGLPLKGSQRYSVFDVSGAGCWLRDVKLVHCDAITATRGAARGDVVYFDPPYVDTFTKYVEDWTPLHLAELIEHGFALKRRGVRVLASDNDTPLTRRLYRRARKIRSLVLPQSMAAQADARKPRRELLVEL